MLGYPNHAAYILERQTARTVSAVNERLASLAPPAVANAEREAADLQAMAAAEGADLELAAWDWSYYTEKVRTERYAFDASQLRPYFEMDNVLENGVFFAANRLYGLTFEARPELPVYHPDVRGVGGVRRRRRAPRAVPQRLLRPAFQAGRGLDERVRVAVAPARDGTGGRQPPERAEAAGRRTDAADLRRGHDDVPRVRARPARLLLRRTLPLLRGHVGPARLRGVPLAGQRDVGHLARGAPELRGPPRDGRADAGGPPRQGAGDAAVQPGVRDHRVPSPRRSSTRRGISSRPKRSPTRPGSRRSRRRPSRRRGSPSIRCRRAIAAPTSRTSGAAATRPATTPISGARCSTPTPSNGSRRTAACGAGTATTSGARCCQRAAASRPWTSFARSGARIPDIRPLLVRRGLN